MLRPDPSWRLQAACRGLDVEEFFFSRGGRNKLSLPKRLCPTCPVRQECLDAAMYYERGIVLDRGVKNGRGKAQKKYLPLHSTLRHGVWGGLTPQERARLARPDTLPDDGTPARGSEEGR